MSELAFFGGPKTVTLDSKEALRWPIYGQEEETAILDVLHRGAMSGTDITIQFENEFAKWMGLSHAVGYTSGTMALAAAMFSIGLGRGDELICPSLTYWASCIQAYLFGATPVFCDVDPTTLCLDPKDFERRITPNTKAVMVVHYIGHPADMDSIMAIAKKHNIKVIEDVSHAQGGLYKGKMLGTFGDVAAMSLMSGKSFAIGEAGIFVTNNRKYYERALVYGHYERNNPENVTDPELVPYMGLPLGSVKGRVHQMSSAVGLVQLKYYDERCKEIRKTMNEFWDQLEGVPGIRAHRVDEKSDSTMAGWYYAHGLYKAEELGGLPIAKFCAAVRAEGVPDVVAGANRPLHTHPMMQTADLYKDGKPTRIAFTKTDVREATASLPVAASINSQIYSVPWMKKYDKALITQFAAAFKKVAANYKELLADPTEFPEPAGVWFTFGAKKADK